MSTLFTNGHIFTAEDDHTFHTAMLVNNGQISWVGDRPQDQQANHTVDLKGLTVLPGLIDVHTHPKYIADALHGVACTPPLVNSIAEMQDALRHSPAFGKGPHTWIEGWGFDETKLAEHRSPNRHDLDQVSTTQPIFIYRSDCHSSVGNSKALDLAGIDRNTPDPVGGFIGHFPDGEPNGFMREVAASQLLIRVKSSLSYETDVKNMVNSSHHYLQNGLVAIGEMMGRKQPYDSALLYHDADAAGFAPKTALYYVFDELDSQQAMLPHVDDRLRIAGIKLFMDGSVSGETAYNHSKYPNGKQGVCLTNAAKLKRAVAFARKNHLQVATHAMGDAANELVVETTKDMDPWLTDRPSIRIEHASLLSDKLLNDIKNAKMNYAICTQPIFFFAEEESYRKYLTETQRITAYRCRSMIDTGRLFALSSDAPCTPWAEPDSPFINIYAAVTRQSSTGQTLNLGEAISVPEAVLAYTKWPAEIGGFTQNGQLVPGKDADFVILNDDIFAVPADQLKSVRVLETWIAGHRVYRA